MAKRTDLKKILRWAEMLTAFTIPTYQKLIRSSKKSDTKSYQFNAV